MKDLMARLDRMFHPKVVAVVGAKKENDYNWLRAYEPFREHGKVYHVNMDRNEWPGAEALGFQNVASLLDIPEPVDHVVVSVPNKAVPFVLRDAITKKVGGVHLFTAGYSETHSEEGMRMEQAMAAMAREADMPVIGPNCMGLYYPKLGMRMGRDQAYGEGGVFGFISQSGTTSMSLGAMAPACGMKVSKGVSFGNGTVVDCTDLLEYLAADPETEIIGMYLEGVRDGRAFFEALRKAASKKPVLVWKVGQSEEGAKATGSHTGSARIEAPLWRALLKQCGAIQVETTQEMMNAAIALNHVGKVGRRVALITVSGGHSGKIADVFGQQGFTIPSPTEDSLKEFNSYASTTGGSFFNPFEGNSLREGENLNRALDIIGRDPSFDLVVMEITAGTIQRTQGFVERRLESVKKFVEAHHKPILVLVTDDVPYSEGVNTKPAERQFLEAGIACINGMEQAAKAMRTALDYHDQHEWLYGRSGGRGARSAR
ncbi:MAG: hypothetical protein EXR55_04205 [Dehalococcoidia bacterium]|nr:hypothetical protein [Dehalococcoidia bacterium]